MSASDRVIGLYEENAAAWDRQRGRDLHETLDPECGDSTLWLALRS